MSKIFYDGKCPVCKKEISLYKKLSMSDSIEWYNVHSNQAALKKVNKFPFEYNFENFIPFSCFIATKLVTEILFSLIDPV